MLQLFLLLEKRRMNKKIVIYGASGHGKVIADIIEKNKGEIFESKS